MLIESTVMNLMYIDYLFISRKVSCLLQEKKEIQKILIF